MVILRGRRLCSISAAVAVLLTLCGTPACSKPAAVSAPPPVPLEAAPQEAVALDLWNAFNADEAAASAKYVDQTLHFARVRVDKMTFLGEGGEFEYYVQEGIDPDVEQVKFRCDTAYQIYNAREGYIVEITGKVNGIRFGYLSVDITWLKVIDPPGGETGAPSEY